jgi:hypothetical protein
MCNSILYHHHVLAHMVNHTGIFASILLSFATISATHCLKAELMMKVHDVSWLTW